MESFIRWIGGKRLLRKRIIAEFPKQYGRYVEVFSGAGWVLFGKEASRFEVYNDIDGELVNLFRCIKYHRKAVEEELKLTFMARETFFEYRDHEALTDIQRAARFYYLIKGSYGADLRSFSCQPCDIAASMERFPKVEERLRNVLIENKSYEAILRGYEREDTLFYLDPPYYGTEAYYRHIFSREDHCRLRELLGNIQGYFILSYNDDPFIRKLYEGFQMIQVDRMNNLSENRKCYPELIIKNFDIL